MGGKEIKRNDSINSNNNSHRLYSKSYAIPIIVGALRVHRYKSNSLTKSARKQGDSFIS